MFFEYILLFLFVFVLNVIPFGMPPTWIILSFLYIQFHLAFLPTILIGVIAATSGRVVLALMARYWLRKVISKRFLKNYEHLGKFLEKNQKLTIPVVLGYAFSPISSNSLFVMAGLSNIKLPIIIFSFMLGRFINYAFLITVSHQLSGRLDKIFTGHFSNLWTWVSALVSITIVIVIGKINWQKLLKRK